METTQRKARPDTVWEKMGVVALVMLFGYAAFSKLLEYGESRQQMRNQVFPEAVADVLAWAVPAAELVVVALLLYRPWRLIGFCGSFGLLTAFSLYIGVVMTGAFGRIPCSCGGILGRLGYGEHLVFNLFFLALSILAIWSHYKAEGAGGRGDGPNPGWQKGGSG